MDGNILKVDMKDYYSNRKLIQSLYINDVQYGDLAGSLLQIRDEMTCIDSMSIEIQNLRIRIELINGESKEEFEKLSNEIMVIYNKIYNAITNFIVNNIDKITDQERSNVIKSTIANGMVYYDISHVGSMIEINL